MNRLIFVIGLFGCSGAAQAGVYFYEEKIFPEETTIVIYGIGPSEQIVRSYVLHILDAQLPRS